MEFSESPASRVASVLWREAVKEQVSAKLSLTVAQAGGADENPTARSTADAAVFTV